MAPMIGITCCRKPFGIFNTVNHAASDTYVRAVDQVVGGIPVLLPANGQGTNIAALLSRLDGIILTGSRSNVLPAHYGGPPHPEGTPEDELRDAVTLPLIRAAVSGGVPILAICRGLQEMNVALGGSLHQRLQDLPGRFDHSTPIQPNARVRIGKAHSVRINPNTWLHRLAETRDVPVNSLHNQGIDRLAPGLVVDAVAPDGTIEAVHAPHAPGGAIGVQWHPEYDFETDAVSRRIFIAFGDAIRARAAGGLASFAAAD